MRGDPPPAAPIERIRSHLVGLRMPRALETLDHIVQQLERGQVSALDAIDLLLAEEITVRESRRIKAALQMARLGNIKTLSGFDFSFQPSLDRNRVLALAQLDFIDRHEVVISSAKAVPERVTWPQHSGSRRCVPAAVFTSRRSPTSLIRWPRRTEKVGCASGSDTSVAPRC
jgi:hypothetical protein